MNKDLALFKNFWSDFPSIFEKPKNLFLSFSSEYEKILNGKCDFEELKDKYLVELEVPGFKKDEINLALKNDILTISWKRSKEVKNEKAETSRYERSEGSFTRSFNVEGVIAGKIEASLIDGILKIMLPKDEKIKPKKIEIK